MKQEIVEGFNVCASKVSVIPYGINNVVPRTNLSTAEAKRRLGLGPRNKAMLFFGNITPYKGLEYLVKALADVSRTDETYRLIIAGKPKWSDDYWHEVRTTIARSGVADVIIQKIEFIPDDATEIYFKAADVLVLPYTHIFQSGVLFLGYSFGLPVLSADVGSLKHEVVEGVTGFIFPPKDAASLARTIERYFSSDLYCELGARRAAIKAWAEQRHSWNEVARITADVYSELLGRDCRA
jgi:glycosyltransferase involved in cell wall biosynthesis